MRKLFLALLLIASPALAQNYDATPGSGLTFGSVVVGGVNYPQQTMCDPATPSQCLAVDSSGRITALQGGTWNVGITGTPTISGTVTANQGGTWTVQPGNIANTVPWLVSASQSGSWNVGQSGSWSVTANAGTNLNTSALALESGGNLASLVTQLGAVTASPGANTVNDRLKTINTTLGSPFQAGGSIGNTAFGISGTLPAFASTPTVNLGTISTAAKASSQTDGSQKTQIVDGSGNIIGSTSNALDINCTAGCIPTNGGTSSSFGSTFPSVGTAIGLDNGTNMVAASADGSGNLKTVVSAALPAGSNSIGTVVATQPTGTNLHVVCDSGCSGGGGGGGTSSNFGSAFPAAGTAIGFTDGTNMVAGKVDGSGNIQVAVQGTVPVSGTFWQATQPVSGTVAATQSGTWNVGLSAGSNLVGKVGIDQTTPGTTNGVQVNAALPAGSNTIGAVTQASGPWTVNQTQVNGTAVLAGNGTAGTGAQRVTVASDNSAVAGFGVGATGSAPPANANYIGTRQTGNLTGLISCDSSVVYDASTSGSTQLVALTSSQTIYVCGFDITVGGTATNVKFNYGTGTACATGTTAMTPAFQIAANGGIVHASPFWSGMKTAASNALCINASAANAVQAVVYYTKF